MLYFVKFRKSLTESFDEKLILVYNKNVSEVTHMIIDLSVRLAAVENGQMLTSRASSRFDRRDKISNLCIRK